MLSCVLVVGKNAECRVIEKLGLRRERHENTIALPLANCGCEIGGQSGWKKKADVLLVEILERYHGMCAETPNDPSSATRPTRALDCNRDAMAGFAAAHG